MASTIQIDRLLETCVKKNASDLHLAVGRPPLLRLHGHLRDLQTKILEPEDTMALMKSITPERIQQEFEETGSGDFGFAYGEEARFRVAIFKQKGCASLVLRKIPNKIMTFQQIGLPKMAEQICRRPRGIFLVTGPTGSGKTTTLYTALKALNSSERKIFTVEDPIEYQLAGINQVQVQPAIGLTFPHALRSILRQDPDIIMIGEIRDLETARIAIQASLTGHLVFSTLHTNSAAATITRLIDMGVENYLIASTVKGVEAQRLVRRLCPHCARPHEAGAYWAETFARDVAGIAALGRADVRQPHGCSRCGGTGFSGRSTIAELLLVDTEIHRLVLAGVSDSEIDASARERGMTSMYASGAYKVWRGETTVEEVLRATRMG